MIRAAVFSPVAGCVVEGHKAASDVLAFETGGGIGIEGVIDGARVEILLDIGSLPFTGIIVSGWIRLCGRLPFGRTKKLSECP